MADNPLLALVIRRVAERTLSNSVLLKITKGYPRMRVCACGLYGSNNCLDRVRHVFISIFIGPMRGVNYRF